MLVMEGLGEGCPDNGLAFALNAQLWTVQRPIVRFGSDAQKQRYLPGLCNGTLLGAHALTEPDAGSDAFSLTMRAERRGDAYVLNGTKCLVTLAPVADVALVFASTNPAAGKWGVSAFVVERTTPGVRASEMQHKMGLRTVPIGELHFEDCVVPESARLGPEGAGVSIATHSLEVERCCIPRVAARGDGAATATLDRVHALAKAVRSGNRQISVGIEPRCRHESSSRDSAVAAVQGGVAGRARAASDDGSGDAQALSERSVRESGMDAIRIHGGVGYLSETGVERDLRDAVGGVLYAGTSDIQRNIIARLLGL
jgi:alkylation response protein AidB-like acyl-CoA dehydrogenase